MTTPHMFQHYQHRYGGVYVVKAIAKSTIDKSEWVVYNHVWPFEEEVWIRPLAEWSEEGRFRQLAGHELVDLLGRNRDQFQAEITAKKAEAKAAEGK
jgi:hypothetical protein